jgi:hypothetical protein
MPLKNAAPTAQRRRIPMCQADSACPLSPLAHRVYAYLTQRAGNTDPARPFTGTIAYSELCTALDPERRHWRPRRYKGIGRILAEVSSYEHAHGRPMLSALVVLKYSRRPGKGFAKLARSLGEQIVLSQEMDFWRNEVERVIAVWTGREVRVTA